jgi:Fe-S oxidoreductase
LGEVRRLGEHNLRLLAGGDEPLVFLEPSCHSIFIDEYRQLGLEGAAEVAARCVPVEDFVLDAVADDEPAWRWTGGAVAVHGHCHSKALADAEAAVRLLARISGIDVLPLDTGCCGMAGAFGMLEANRELSRAVARPLIEAIGALPRGARVAAAGTSCRHQIAHLAGVEAVHPIEIVAEAMSG